KARPIQPDHQRDCRTECPVGFVEVCEMTEVGSEKIRQADPATNREDRTRQCCEEPLLDVWSKEIQNLDCHNGEPDRNGPMYVGPEQDKQIRQMNSRC